MTNSESPRRGTRSGAVDVFVLIGLLAVAAVYVRAVYFTPTEATQGVAQKILYVHAASAWVAMLAFITVGLAGAAYLWMRDERLDRFSMVSVEVGLVFITLALITGPIWGKVIWGAYWSWGDARLTSTLILWLVYLGYVTLRGAVEDRQLRARYSAIIGLMGALLVPFVHLSVYLFDSMHPLPVVMSPDALGPERRMDDRMFVTMMLSLGAFMLLYTAFLRSRYRLETMRERLRERADKRGVQS